MRAAPLLLFASALVISGLGAAVDGPDFSLDTAAPALASAPPDCLPAVMAATEQADRPEPATSCRGETSPD